MVARCSSIIFRDTDKPSPVPVPTGLVVKKGSEEFVEFVIRYASAGVVNFHHNASARRSPACVAGDRRLAGESSHRQIPVVAHRMNGVHENVDEHLLDLVPVQLDLGKWFGEVFLQGKMVRVISC